MAARKKKTKTTRRKKAPARKKKTTTTKAPAEKSSGRGGKKKNKPIPPPKKDGPGKAKANGAAIDRLLFKIQKKHGTNVRRYSAEAGRGAVDEVISTGLDALDRYVIAASDPKGNHGLPVGRASEVYSEEGVGKTSFMLGCLAQAQNMGGLAALADSEYALDPRWAENVYGIRMSDLVIMEADCMEWVIEQVLDLLQSKRDMPKLGPLLIAWDSIAATPPLAEIRGMLDDDDEDTFHKAKVAERARLLSDFCRRWTAALKPARAHLMFLNQIREKIGVLFGDNTTTPGGHAVKFHASHRIQLLGGKAFKDDEGDHLGKDITFLCSKNKLAPPWRKAVCRLDFVRGWDNEWTTIRYAKDHDVDGVSGRARGHATYLKAIKALGWPEREVPL